MKEQRPRVTVGLPTYNGERYLAEAIRSMLDQDFGDFELLVADNASTDGTRAIIERFAAADARVRHLPSEVNRGAAWNFNRVVGVARGEYFKWMADDDTYEPGFLRACVDVLDDARDVVLCYTQAVEIDADGEVIERRGPTNVADKDDVAQRFRAILLDEIYCYAVFGVIRTGVLRSTGLIGPFTQSDRVLLAELALHGRFVERPEAFFCHREHPGRSMYAFADDRDRLTWFDTSRDGKRTLPRWRVGAEYAKALQRAGHWLSAEDQVRSAVHLLPWSVVNRRVLSREVARTAMSRGRELVHSRRSGSSVGSPISTST
jgi:glycosyltransferase involved in cell wall biosynthesis